MIIEVYSNAQEVDLLINGVSQGKRPVGTDAHGYYCAWDTMYQPGKIEAVAYVNGQEVGRYELETAGKPLLRATAETCSLRSGSNDLCYVNIELVDENGVLNTASDTDVTVRLEGAGVLQGSGSGNPKHEENYFDTTHRTFFGRMLAVIRAGDQVGVAKLIASADGMDSVEVQISVQ